MAGAEGTQCGDYGVGPAHPSVCHQPHTCHHSITSTTRAQTTCLRIGETTLLIEMIFKYRDKWWVIDIAGNHLRLIAFISFRINKVFVKHIVSHAEYDRLTNHYRRNKE